MSPLPLRCASRVHLVLLVLCGLLIPARLHALAMGPGLFMVQNVPPGQEVDLRKLGGVLFTVENDSGQEQDFNLTCRKPSQSGLTEWEKGYEEIPDPAWCRLEQESFTIPANGRKQIGLVIAIPPAAENRNRRFMLAVVLRTGKDPAFGVGLAIAARVQIETTVAEELPATVGGGLTLAPATLAISGRPGATVGGRVHLRNDSGQGLQTRLERLAEVYQDPAKHGRYVSNGYQPHPGDAWLAPTTTPAALAAGATTTLDFTGTIPADAAPGQRFEELAFVRGTTADGKALLSFVRLHLHTVAGDAAPVPPRP